MLEPAPASTVVVCRITTQWPHKILLVKRSEKAAFLPGAYVFPGGRLEQNDYQSATFVERDGTNCARFRSYFSDTDRAASFVYAAVREVYEETGLVIVRNSVGTMLDKLSLEAIITTGATSTINPNFATVWPISWWITPQGETRRFDTRFFFALIDDDPSLDSEAPKSAEGISHMQWWAPHEALAAYDQGAIFLAPPTRSILERMTVSDSLETFLSYVDKPLRPIRPFFVEDEVGNKTLILPGDPFHEEPLRPRMLMHTRYKFP